MARIKTDEIENWVKAQRQAKQMGIVLTKRKIVRRFVATSQRIAYFVKK